MQNHRPAGAQTNPGETPVGKRMMICWSRKTDTGAKTKQNKTKNPYHYRRKLNSKTWQRARHLKDALRNASTIPYKQYERPRVSNLSLGHNHGVVINKQHLMIKYNFTDRGQLRRITAGKYFSISDVLFK